MGPKQKLDQGALPQLLGYRLRLAQQAVFRDFAASVQSPERLRLLLVLTVVDIRAVGPGVWNSWKRQLLHELYNAAEERMRLGHAEHNRAQRVARVRAPRPTSQRVQ